MREKAVSEIKSNNKHLVVYHTCVYTLWCHI